MATQKVLFSPYISSKPRIIAGYSTRFAGDMKKENIQIAFFRSIGMKSFHLFLPSQYHSNTVKEIKRIASGDQQRIKADALLIETNLASDAPVIIGVLTADCTPILIYEPTINIVGVIHAGWKGTANGIIPNTIKTIVSLGGDTGSIRVSIGPVIGGCCYNVDSDRYELFRQTFGETDGIVRKTDEGKLFVNLAGAAQSALMRSGVKRDNIEQLSYCTKCNSKRWWSYRADGMIKGEQMAFIAVSQKSLLL